MSKRYVYVVRMIEHGIIGVWSSKQEAIDEAIEAMKEVGVSKWDVDELNSEFVIIFPIVYEIFEKAEVIRFEIK